MKEVLGKPLLEFQIERVRKSKLITRVVVATTTKETEQPIIDLCKRLSVDCFRGSEMDVLARYFEAANLYKADVVVRLTSDDPLIDPTIIDKIIAELLSNPSKYDYVSNSIDRTYPLGLDTEVFSMNALKQAYQEATSPAYREHVTPYIRLHPDKFNIGVVKHPVDLSSYRLTVDTEEDLELISRVLEELYEKKREYFTMEDIIVLLQQHQDWTLLNSHIEQKKLEDEL